MAIAVVNSGTQLAVISTEHTLVTTVVSDTYCYYVDLFNMASGDELELYIYLKILSGGTLRPAYYQKYVGARPVYDMIAISVPVATDLGADFTLKQTAGTGRNFAWKVLSL